MQQLNPATWLIVLAFGVAVLEGLSFFDEKRKRLWRVLILIDALFILVFGVAAQYQQDAKNAEIAQITRELANKSDEIAKIATGGDSFCYLGFVFGEGAANTPSLVVIQDGKYPLQHIKVIITDMELFRATLPDVPKGRAYQRPITAEELEKVDNLNVIFDVDALGPPGSMLRLRPGWKLPERDQVTYSIKLLTQFQTFYQHLKLRKVNGQWAMAYRVIKRGPDKEEELVLREHISNNFPRDQSGKVSWQFE